MTLSTSIDHNKVACNEEFDESLFYSADFEILIGVIECPEKSKNSENFDLESRIRKDIHERQESEI